MERMEQDLKRYESELENQTLIAVDLPPGGTPQKTHFPPAKYHNDIRFEELQEKYNQEVEERKKLEAELKSLHIKQEQTLGSLTSSQGTPLKRGYDSSHFPLEQEGTPSKQIFRTERKFSDHSQPNEHLKIHNQELRSKVHELELRLQVQEKDLKNNLNTFQETLVQLEKVQLELAERDKALHKSRDELLRTTTQFDQMAAKCILLEQKVKELSEELCCQRQNAESALCTMEQKMKEMDKEYQAEFKKGRNQYDQTLREAHQLEEELKTKQDLKERQHFTEEFTNTAVSQEAKLQVAQEMLENVNITTVHLGKERNTVEDLLKSKDFDETKNKLIHMKADIEALQNIIREKDKECEELKKENTFLSGWKLNMEQSTVKLKFEREELLGKIEVLERSIETQQEVVKSLEMEKETLDLQIQDLHKMVENKCVELELQKQAFVELQQKTEYTDQKHRKEEENVSWKISQFTRQIEKMDPSSLKDQLSSLELSLHAEKQLNSELQKQVEELLKSKIEVEKHIGEAEKMHVRKDLETEKCQPVKVSKNEASFQPCEYTDNDNKLHEKHAPLPHELTLYQTDDTKLVSSLQMANRLEAALPKNCERIQFEKLELASELHTSKTECIAATQLLKEEVENLVNQINVLQQEKSVLYSELMDLKNKNHGLITQPHHSSSEPLYFELEDDRKSNSEHVGIPSQNMASHHAELKQNVCSLQRKHELLNGQYNSMMSQMSELQSSYAALKTENAVLMNKQNPSNSMEMQVTSCTKEAHKLSEAILLAQTKMSDRTAEACLECTFENTANTTMDSYAELQHFKEIILEDQPETHLLENHLHSVSNCAIAQETFPPTKAVLEAKIKELEPCCQTYEKSIRAKEEQLPTHEPAQSKEVHELKQAIESNRKELDSLIKQHLSEKEKWQQTLRDLTKEMETKLASEKQQTEYLSLELETARLELQCLDLSARSILFPDSDNTHFRPEIHGMHRDTYKNNSTHNDSAGEELTMNLEKSSTDLTLENIVKPEECNESQKNNTEFSNCRTESTTINDKSSIATMHVQEYQVIIDKLQGQQLQICSENLVLHKDIEENKARVDTLLMEIKELYSKFDSDNVADTANMSEQLELEKKVLELEHENKHCLQSIASLSSENQQLSSSIMDLRNNLESITSLFENCKVQLLNAREMLNNSEKAKVDWNEKYLETENELKRTKSEKVNIENHALAMEADIEELHLKNQHLQKESDNQIKLISNLEEQLTVVLAAKNQLNQELCSLTEGHEELDHMHQKLKEKVKELESWKIDSTEFIKILEADIKTQKTLFQATQSGVDQLSMGNSNITQLQNQVRELNEEKEMFLRASEALKNKISELENENVRLTTALECIFTEKSDILSQLSCTQGEVTHMRSDMETLKERIESDDKKKQHMVEKLKESERKADSLQDKIESLQRDFEMSEETLENMIVQAETSKEESADLNSLQVDMAEKLKDLNLECDVLRVKNEELNTELQQARERVSELKASQSTVTNILEKHEEEKGKLLEEYKSLVSSLQTQLKCLDEELLEKENIKQELEKNVDTLTLQREELQRQVGQFTSEREVLLRASENLQTKLSESETENSRLSLSLGCILTEKREIASRLNSTQEEVAQMRSGIEKLKLRMESDEKKKQHLIEKLKQSERIADALKEKIERLERDLQMSEENLESMILQVESSKDNAENLKALKRDEIEKLTHLELLALKAENEELNKKLQQTREKVSELESCQLSFTEILEKCEQEKAKLVEESNTFVSSLQTQLQYLQEEIVKKNNLIKVLQEFERNASMQLLQKEELQRQVRTLSEEKECVLTTSETLQTKLTESESEVLRISKAFECVIAEKGEIDSRLTSSQEVVVCMQSAIEDLKLQIELHEKENQGHIENLKQSERKADSLQDKIESLERNMQVSEENLEDMIVQVETSKEEAENLQALNDDLMKKLKDSDFELDALRAKHHCLNKELQQSREKVSDLENSQSNVSEILEKYQQEKVKILEESKSLVSSLQTQLEELNKQLEDRDHLLQIKQEYQKTAEMQIIQMVEIQHQVRQLNEENERLLRTSDTLQTKLSESESEITRLTSSLECVLIEKGNIESRLTSANQEVAHMHSGIEDLKLQIGTGEKENQDMMEELKRSERKADSLQDKIESLERNVLMSEENLENMVIQVETSKEEAEHLKTLVEDMTTKKKDLDFELGAIEAKNEALNKELQQSQKKVSELEASHSNISDIVEQYEQEKVKMLEESKSLVSSLQAQLNNLNKQLEDRNSLLHLKQEYEKNAEMQILQMEELQRQVRQQNEEKELLLQTSETLQTKLTGAESEVARLSKAFECLLIEKGELESKLTSTQEEVTQLKSTIGNLKMGRESDEKENQNMIEKLSVCEQKANYLNHKIESVERDLRLSENNLESMTIQTETYKEEAENLKALKEAMTEKQRHLDLELDALRAKHKVINKELQQTRERVSELEVFQSIALENLKKSKQEKVKIEEESKSLVLSLQTQLKNVNCELVLSCEERETMKLKEQDMASKLICLELDKVQLLQKLKDAQSSNINLQSSNEEYTQRLVEYKQKLNEKNQESDMLQQEIKDAEEWKEKLSSSVESCKREKAGLQKLTDELEQKITSMSTETEALKDTVEAQHISLMNLEKELTSSISEKSALVTKHEVEIQIYQEKLVSVEQSLSAQNLEIHILKSSKDELNESLKHANKKLEELNQVKVEKLKSTLAQLQKENKAARGKLELFTKSYKQLEKEKKKLQKHVAEQEAVITDLKESKKQNDEMENNLKTLKSELKELQEYADEKSRETEETIEKYCGLMINQHKLEELNEMLTSRVDFLIAQLKQPVSQNAVTFPLPSSKSCEKTSSNEKKSSKGPAHLSGKRPRTVEGKDDKEPKTSTSPNVPKRVKSKINSEMFYRTAAGKEPEFELEGLPSVVQKGFADIPEGNPKSPYVVRRTTLRTSPRLAAQKTSPVNPSPQKGVFDTLPDVFKPTVGDSRPQKLNVQKVQAASEMGSLDSSWSPLSAHNNNIDKKTLQSPKDNMKIQKGRRSRTSKKLAHSTEEENCKVQ